MSVQFEPARIAAVLRCRRDHHEGPNKVGELVVHPVRRQVTDGERVVPLARKESALRVFANDPTRVFPKEELLHEV